MLAALQPEELGTNHSIAQFALAFGLMITVTALPVLAALLKEMGYLHTPLGQTALGLAAINDAGLWAGLTVLLLFMALGGAMLTALLMPAYLAGVVVVRWLLARLAARVTLQGTRC
ncbi:cation:proton antiporter [Hankyongella ginsenosidimutans]|uniref:cation:proton antiporter domain-containing protein n=1 Tax=Hankyongella ginsenosidimutans TaxID=1763828 RepID=UPI002482972B|nr:cation:proton antiporter [Hankyongella ginsenosidimutans]